MKTKTVSLLLSAFIGAASAQSTIDPARPYAWGANIGWTNWHPAPGTGVVVGEYVCSGYFWAPNCGWIHLGDGTPENAIRYTNSSATDYGVNHDGTGNLSGYAYSANLGWINFGWAAAGDPKRPRFDLLTGAFSGFAYSANAGWLHLGTGDLATSSMAVTDTDRDGIADEWERSWFPSLTTATATSDTDHDGASDKDEYFARTNPANPTDWLRIISHTFDGSHTRATIVLTTNTARLYRLEVSGNMEAWSDSGIGTFAPDTGATTTRIITWPGATRQFIRAVAVRPLP